MIKYDVQDVRGDLWKKGKVIETRGFKKSMGSPEVVKRFLINTHLHRFSKFNANYYCFRCSRCSCDDNARPATTLFI